jgi:hypothetical protein
MKSLKFTGSEATRMRQSITNAAIRRIQARQSAPVPPEEISMLALKWKKPELTNGKPELTRKRNEQKTDIQKLKPRRPKLVPKRNVEECTPWGSTPATWLPKCAWTIIIPFLSTRGLAIT